MIQTFLALLRNDDGATLVEYALVIGLIAAVAVLGLTQFGKATNSSLSNSASRL